MYELSLNDKVLSNHELENINGGLFPIVIAGMVITGKSAAWGAGALAAGAATGYLLNR
ncbi:class IIb bacteriocin, lactobin A/cerein 7B family [Fructobacillus durionis]|uniref:Class IIb bacteriocin, lactobin A/cerein 7B family n=1 Tax=Fructobacillus durionis TaxID=283737 RepID=A0A1I1F3E9_9LACO|nr:class IIb bacteriocin, lactobin A/cerein 7B family [Fructobacillus durionis]SFB93791.1 class IIb bacteriocin, lactobin A/cerein 7B family [Fructobacillus durionis]